MALPSLLIIHASTYPCFLPSDPRQASLDNPNIQQKSIYHNSSLKVACHETRAVNPSITNHDQIRIFIAVKNQILDRKYRYIYTLESIFDRVSPKPYKIVKMVFFKVKMKHTSYTWISSSALFIVFVFMLLVSLPTNNNYSDDAPYYRYYLLILIAPALISLLATIIVQVFVNYRYILWIWLGYELIVLLIFAYIVLDFESSNPENIIFKFGAFVIFQPEIYSAILAGMFPVEYLSILELLYHFRTGNNEIVKTGLGKQVIQSASWILLKDLLVLFTLLLGSVLIILHVSFGLCILVNVIALGVSALIRRKSPSSLVKSTLLPGSVSPSTSRDSGGTTMTSERSKQGTRDLEGPEQANPKQEQQDENSVSMQRTKKKYNVKTFFGDFLYFISISVIILGFSFYSGVQWIGFGTYEEKAGQTIYYLINPRLMPSYILEISLVSVLIMLVILIVLTFIKNRIGSSLKKKFGILDEKKIILISCPAIYILWLLYRVGNYFTVVFTGSVIFPCVTIIVVLLVSAYAIRRDRGPGGFIGILVLCGAFLMNAGVALTSMYNIGPDYDWMIINT
ncbi:MAG: hypothetical protein ACTSRA_10235, partial [Promethearchaeota archaeon]